MIRYIIINLILIFILLVIQNLNYSEHLTYPNFHYVLQKWQEDNPNINPIPPDLSEPDDFDPPWMDYPERPLLPDKPTDDNNPGFNYNVPSVYRNFPDEGKSLNKFYEKCIECADESKSFKWNPSAEIIPCKDINRIEDEDEKIEKCNASSYCQINESGNNKICMEKELTPEEQVELTKAHYNNVNIDELQCSDLSDTRINEFIDKCDKSNNNCNQYSENQCKVDFNLDKFCEFNNDNCNKINCNNLSLLKSYIKNTCKKERDFIDDKDITGRYGCPGDVSPNPVSANTDDLVCPLK